MPDQQNIDIPIEKEIEINAKFSGGKFVIEFSEPVEEVRFNNRQARLLYDAIYTFFTTYEPNSHEWKQRWQKKIGSQDDS